MTSSPPTHDPFTLQEARLHADNGAVLLDEIKPEWAAKIDIDTLDMSDAQCCIIGQLVSPRDVYEPFFEKAERFFVETMQNPGMSNQQTMLEMGFASPTLRAYAALDIAWKELIAERIER